MHTDPGQGASWGPFVTGSRDTHRECPSPSCRVVIQQKSGQEPALNQLVVGVGPSLGVGGGLA